MPFFDVTIQVGLNIEAENKEDAESKAKEFINNLMLAVKKASDVLKEVSTVEGEPEL